MDTPKYTKHQKELLIKYLTTKRDEELNDLRQQSNKYCNNIEKTINRRINRVSVTLWNVKLKDILDVERVGRPTVRSLLGDVKKYRETTLKRSNGQKKI